MDNPKTRQQLTCPFCHGFKDRGLVACWKCFRSSGLKNGDRRAEQTLKCFEEGLER